jgi:glyoxylase-like metal-dependent hydrolase (beta-lactamase superfamily II)
MYQTRAVGSRGTLFSTDTIPGCVTNLYLIKGNKTNYLIDTGFGSGTAQFINRYIDESCPNPVIVINTHYHWDHIWGNIGFEEKQIIGHAKIVEMIEQNWAEMISRSGKFIEGQTKKVLPNTLFEDRMAFPEDGVEIFYSPGHTVDSISVYDHLDKMLYVGDNVEDPMPGIYDSHEHCIQSLRKYLEYDFTYCISGHNGTSSHPSTPNF